MKYRRYAAYKDSGVEWLGEVPAHWKVDRLKWTVDGCINGIWGDEPDGENDVVCIRVADFDRVRNRVRDSDYTVRFIPIQQRNGRMLRVGDLLIEKSGGGDLQPVGVVVLFEHKFDAVSSNFVARMPVRPGMNSNFLCYLHAALYSVRLNTCSIKQNTGIQNLDSSAYLDEKVALPSVEDQNAIAAFLDCETSKIDALIAKQGRLIAVLQEKRQALISHAVTKGLNPDAPMKDSGVEWLGEVPAHWGVKRLKHIAAIQTGVAKGRDLSGQDTIHVPYMRVANVQDGHLDLADVTTIEIARSELERYRLQAGDVLMNEGGDNDKLGRGHIWRAEIDPCIHQNHVFAVRPHEVEPEWLTLVTGADYAKFYFFSFAKQSTNLASISSSNLRELPVMCPPLPERNEIRMYVAVESVKIDTLIQKAKTAIGKLQARRAALISAAVTGMIDVRDIP